MITTPRVRLRPWREADRAPLAAMLADPEVMHDYPAPLSRRQSDQKLDHYQLTFVRLGYGRMALETLAGEFLGYVGIMPLAQTHAALGEGVEIGWRLVRPAWGRGFATEAARAALVDGFRRHRFAEVLSYTSPGNVRSEAVMQRLGLNRQPHRDFAYEIDAVTYLAIVFAADRASFKGASDA